MGFFIYFSDSTPLSNQSSIQPNSGGSSEKARKAFFLQTFQKSNY